MKKFLIVFITSILIYPVKNYAQCYVHVRPVFSPRIVVRVGPAPYAGAVWIAPEWRWEPYRRCYIEVPGYWARPAYRRTWRPGHWHYTPWGYEWIPGHWAHW